MLGARSLTEVLPHVWPFPEQQTARKVLGEVLDFHKSNDQLRRTDAEQARYETTIVHPSVAKTPWIALQFRVSCAWVAKLVDAPDSKSGSFTGVSVRFRSQVPLHESSNEFANKNIG
jgi:hypothetical protein